MKYDPLVIGDLVAKVPLIQGGAVGVAVLVRNDKDINCRSVCSSMHFEPVEHMEWRMTFSEKPAEDAVIKLI